MTFKIGVNNKMEYNNTKKKEYSRNENKFPQT